MLVELHLDRPAGRHHRHPGAAVVRQQFLELAEVARQHRQVDVVAAQVGVPVGRRAPWLLSSTTWTTSPSGSSSARNVSKRRSAETAAESIGSRSLACRSR